MRLRLEYINAFTGAIKVDGLVLEAPDEVTKGEGTNVANDSSTHDEEERAEEEEQLDWKTLHVATHVLRLRIGRALQSKS